MTQLALPLEKMSVPEKLDVMERVWESLRQQEEKFESPAWHEAALREAKAAFATGKAKFSDWDEAKKRLRRKTAKRS